jgi:septum formation protein
MTTAFSLILGSTSPYRQQLLQRLGVPFKLQAPDVDESAITGEAPDALATRLAIAKALAVARQVRRPDVAGLTTLVIGSDQVIDLDGRTLGKPGSHERAVAQLQAARGATLRVYTAVAVARASDLRLLHAMCETTVRLRQYSDVEIQTYLELDRPYDCAGAIKSESLGITLIESMNSDDPTSLIGLPLIDTIKLLRQFDYDVLSQAASVPA